MYEGKKYTDCVSFRDDEPAWCATTINFDEDGLWGYCLIETFGGTGGGQPCQFPFWAHGKKYEMCTTSGFRGGGKPWCATGPTQPNGYEPASWGFCSDGVETEMSWGWQCDCPAGFSGLRCEQACRPHRYGANCAFHCPDCGDNGACDSVTGKCICKPGFQGDLCDQTCTAPDCEFSCAEGKTPCALEGTKSCDEASKTCSCKPGYQVLIANAIKKKKRRRRRS